MLGSGGFEATEQVGPAHMPVAVLITAHNEYAVQAFEVHALDDLNKPVEPKRLQGTLMRVKERTASNAALLMQEQLKSVLTGLENGRSRQGEYPTASRSHRHKGVFRQRQ
jgi:two-component system LytT family response regulator